MTGIWKRVMSSGMTNADVRLLNWVVLALIVVELVRLLFAGDLSSTLSRIRVETSFYVLFLLLGPTVFQWIDPGMPVERKGAWVVGVVAYGGVALALILWTVLGILLALFD